MRAFIFLITAVLFANAVSAYDFSDSECVQVKEQMTMDYQTFNDKYTPYYQPPQPIILPVNPQSFVLQTNQTNLFTDPHQFASREPMRLQMSLTREALAFEPYYGALGQGTLGRSKWTDWDDYLGPLSEKNVHSLSPKKFKHKDEYIKVKLNAVPGLRIDKEGTPYCIYSDIQFYRINDNTFRVNDRGSGVHEIRLPQGVSWYNLDKLHTPKPLIYNNQMRQNQEGLLTYTQPSEPQLSPVASGLKAAIIFQGMADTTRIPHCALRINDNIYHLERIFPAPCQELGKWIDYNMDIPSYCQKGVYSSGNKVTYSNFADYQRHIKGYSAVQVEAVHLSREQVHALHTNLFNTTGQNAPHDSSSNFVQDHLGKIGADVPSYKFDSPQTIEKYIASQSNYVAPDNWRDIGHNYKADTYLIPTNWYNPSFNDAWDKTTPARPFLGPLDR